MDARDTPTPDTDDSSAVKSGPAAFDGTPTLADRVDDALVALDGLRQRRWFVVCGIVVAVACVIVALVAAQREQPPVDDLIPQVSLSVTTATPGQAVDEVTVHVVGEVNRPGVYQLPGDQRIEDAVRAAGGPTSSGDLHALNLAAPVVDGSQIRVPRVGEPVESALVTGPEGSTTAGPVNLNTATAEQLAELPGIGPSISEAIIEYRSANGPFVTIDDLLEVPGIGPAKLSALVDEATVR